MKKIYLSQDIGEYAVHSKIIKKYKEFLEEKNIPSKDTKIFLVGKKQYFYSYEKNYKDKVIVNDFNILDNIESAKVNSKLTAIYTNINSVKLPLIRILRASEEGYLILMGESIKQITQHMKDFEIRKNEYVELKEKRDSMQESLKEIKSSIRDKKKKIRESEDEEYKKDMKYLISSLEEKEEELSKKILRIREIVKSERVTAASFLSEHLLEFGVFNVVRGFNPVYIHKDLMVLKVKDTLTQGITNSVVESFLTCLNESKEKDLSSKEKLQLIKDYTFSAEVEFVWRVPHFTNGIDLIDSIEEFPEIDMSRNILMTDTQTISPIKPHIMASLLASGTAGSLNKEVTIKDGEQCLIKSIMAQHEHVETVFINGERTVERTSTWKPQLGIYNKLRKEVKILKDD